MVDKEKQGKCNLFIGPEEAKKGKAKILPVSDKKPLYSGLMCECGIACSVSF